ncbi:MAG: virulence RhuM family protein [Nitrosomonas sp.]|nr:virulence RhuM family protein [Nitrosomonas sp.]
MQRIREIRLSGRKFYQKITDIYATSIDQGASVAKVLWATNNLAISWKIFHFSNQFYPK